MSFPEGLPEKRGKLGHVRQELLQPGKAYSAEELEGGPGARGEEGRTGAAPVSGKGAARRARRAGQTSEGAPPTAGKLRSMSELHYPEAYRPVDPTFWQGLSGQQRDEVMRLQAVAQEKVGFERGTPKYFIDTYELTDWHNAPTVDLVQLATPRLVMGGMLIGAGLLLAVLGVSSVIGDLGWAAFGAAGVVFGVLTVAFGRN